jgi:hypothetical protein
MAIIHPDEFVFLLVHKGEWDFIRFRKLAEVGFALEWSDNSFGIE